MKPKVLFFIATNRPTNYDRQRASKLDASVSFRNVANIKATDPIETCDGVTGGPIPTQYVGKPTAQEAIRDAVAASVPQISLKFDAAPVVAVKE